jgi:hypothetical protein
LDDYILAEELQNIYLVFEAVKDRRRDANIATSFSTLNFT